MIPVSDTFKLMQQQKSFFGKLAGLVFDSRSANQEANKDKYVVTSALIQLHSRVTTLILLCGLLLLSLNEYFGETISCLESADASLPAKLLEKYCWFEGNFVFYDQNSVSKPTDEKPDSTLQQAYPGVSSSGEHKFPLKYYQWVYFVLIIQSILFYLPKFHWDLSEGRQLAELTEMLNKKFDGSSAPDDEEMSKMAQEVYDAMIVGARSLRQFIYSEIFCLVHLVAEIWFIDVFLNGQFIKLGYHWLIYDSEQQVDNRDDPLIRVFPRLSKCQFHKYGFSGSIETHDALCFLGLNIVNEKLYLVLWFWLLFLGCFTIIFLAIRLIYFSVPALRNSYLHVHAPSLNKSIGYRLSRSTGPWFVTRFLISYMKPCNFADLMEIVYRKHFELNLEQRRRWLG